MLRVDDIRVTIKGFIILRGLSLEVPDGGTVGLVGRNGAGKTTTMKSIMGIVSLTGGRIDLDGTDLTGVPGHHRAMLGIGYMPEDRRLIGQLTVEDNIMLPAWAAKLNAAEERLHYIYEMMPELREFAGRKATSLSGGQQKMAALARAVMSGSKLLLLDEPFEGLSPGMGNKLADMIKRLNADGATVLLAESDQNRLDFVKQIYQIERGENFED